MAGGPGYFDTGAGRGDQPSTFSTTWPTAPGADQWGSINPQNYSGGGMPPAVPIYPTGSVPVAAPIPVPVFQPATSADAWNYIPPPTEPAAGRFDARNYQPPDPTQMPATYEPRTSESAFNNSMMLHGGGGVTSPVVPPASYLLSPALSSSSSGDSYSQSMPSALYRSGSSRPKEREVWLYDRPGTWRPRFQMPRSGVTSLMRGFSQMRNFPPGASYVSQLFLSL